MKIKLLFAWYDLWVGLFYDKNKNWLYILPIPMFGIVFKFPEKWRISYVIRILKLPNYGKCIECKRERATHDYNGHQYYVCEDCYNRLNDEFDEICK